MKYDEILSQVKDLVKTQADLFSNKYAIGISAWTGHVQIVEKYAMMFAKQRNADLEIVNLAAVLHDYARYLDMEKYGAIHAEKGAELAKEILLKYNYNKEKIEKISKCILFHDMANQYELNSLEGICLADADGYTHIVNCFEIYNAFKVLKKQKTTKELLQIVLKKLEGSFDKLGEWGKSFAKEDYVNITSYIKKAIIAYQE